MMPILRPGNLDIINTGERLVGRNHRLTAETPDFRLTYSTNSIKPAGAFG